MEEVKAEIRKSLDKKMNEGPLSMMTHKPEFQAGWYREDAIESRTMMKAMSIQLSKIRFNPEATPLIKHTILLLADALSAAAER